MQKKQIFTLIGLVIIFLGSFYVSGFSSLINLSFTLFFYSLFTYLLYGIYKKFRDPSHRFFSLDNYNIFLNLFLYRVTTMIIVLIVIIGGFSYYQNELSKAKMPIYTITNGEQQIVFHAMSHIGSENFYTQVKENIKKYKENDFVYYFEGVKPGSKENHEGFDKALGVTFNEKTYENMSQLYGLVNQNNQDFLGLVNDLDFNVDISIDEIMEKYSSIKSEAGISNRSYNPPLDAGELIDNELKRLTPRELIILRYVNKAFINIIVKSHKTQETLQNNFSNKELFKVILDERNKVIADKILTGEDKKIIMTYGLLHFEGIFNILKQNSLKWHIEKIDYLYPLK